MIEYYTNYFADVVTERDKIFSYFGSEGRERMH